jgi:GNAT superfamily N-acetyltransferase
MTDGRNPPWPGDLRTAADSDAAGVQQLIGGCFAEYDGCVLDLEGIDAWMAAPASYYAAIGGQFWVGWGPVGEDRIELKNLYVSADGRRQGLGRRLVALVETSGCEQAAAAVVLWSDTRFLDAHRLYESLGYQRTGQERALHDPSQSIEYGFAKRL